MLTWIINTALLFTLFSSSVSHASDCAGSFAEKVTQTMGRVSHDQSSFMTLDLALVPAQTREMILQKTLKDFDHHGSLKTAHFFSQFTIDEDGRLNTTVCPCIRELRVCIRC